MIPFSDYCREKGFTRQRGLELRKLGRFGDALITRPHGKTSRYFVTSIEEADEALEQTAAGPRGRTAESSNQPPKSNMAPRTSRKNSRGAAPVGKTMTRAEAIRLKAEHDAHSAGLKREKLAVENEHARGELISVADAERQIDTWTARVVSMIAAIPSRVAQAGVPAAVVDVVRREINRAREEIARKES